MVSRYSKYVKKYSEFSLKLDKVVLLKVILSLLRIAVLLQKCNSSGYLARCFARALESLWRPFGGPPKAQHEPFG